MQKVIDVRDMNTAIHSLYLVKRCPKNTCKLFWSLSTFNDNGLDEFESMEVWNQINENVESLGEIHYQYIKGDKYWKNGVLLSDNVYDDGTKKYKVIGSYDIW